MKQVVDQTGTLRQLFIVNTNNQNNSYSKRKPKQDNLIASKMLKSQVPNPEFAANDFSARVNCLDDYLLNSI